jgi:TM2 domain-containing membrane protein YozV
MRDPGLAAVLSAIIPGVGQFYNGRILAGILWLIITPGLWIGTGGLLGWVCHVIVGLHCLQLRSRSPGAYLCALGYSPNVG